MDYYLATSLIEENEEALRRHALRNVSRRDAFNSLFHYSRTYRPCNYIQVNFGEYHKILGAANKYGSHWVLLVGLYQTFRA